MTVPTTTSAISYTGTGSLAVYPYTWAIAQAADLLLYTLTGGITVAKLALAVDYTVSGVGNPTGGTITLSAGNLPSGTKLLIASDPLQVQQILLAQGSAFNPADLMNALDLLTREVQANRRLALNGIQFPTVESLAGLTSVLPAAATRALQVLAFDAFGNAIVQPAGAGGGGTQFLIPKTITCWGDSLTLGVVGNGPSYPAQLTPLSNCQCYNAGVGGDTSAQILALINAASAALLANVTVIWAGRNDIGVNTNPTILANIAAMVAKLNTQQFLILSVVNGEGEGIGTTNYTQVTGLNGSLLATYPNNYYDIRAYLVQQYNPSIPSDVTDHTNDIPPGSLRWDSIHYLGAGYAFVAAQVEAFLHGKGWV